MGVVYIMNHEATMSGARKVRVLPLPSRGSFLVLKVRIDMGRIYVDTMHFCFQDERWGAILLDQLCVPGGIGLYVWMHR